MTALLNDFAMTVARAHFVFRSHRRPDALTLHQPSNALWLLAQWWPRILNKACMMHAENKSKMRSLDQRGLNQIIPNAEFFTMAARRKIGEYHGGNFNLERAVVIKLTL